MRVARELPRGRWPTFLAVLFILLGAVLAYLALTTPVEPTTFVLGVGILFCWTVSGILLRWRSRARQFSGGHAG